eukprot:TRINITY_DN281_c2_g2_i1.p1 TRINITY_DN281_c2_g2~~TRINITY_DN281_c2_g2_i1.p1  ORF type:complete len:171 (+),score=15.35 TRINITY_DN281_c2_g2_i1:148-660(+)
MTQAYNDAAISSSAILSQLHCEQKTLEASANTMNLDCGRLELLMRKYGKDNFMKGDAFLTAERSKVAKRHAAVTSRIDSIQQHLDHSLSLAHSVQAARNAMSSPPYPHPSVERSILQQSLAGSPIPHHSTIPLADVASDQHRSPRTHRVPTVADSRILSNSSTFMKESNR